MRMEDQASASIEHQRHLDESKYLKGESNMIARQFIAIAFALWLSIVLQADEFHVNGTGDVFTVTAETLAKTPQWDPLVSECPVSVASAIKVAREYHDKAIPEGRTTFHAWQLAGATLVRHEGGHWYWIVQYRGLFDPQFAPSKDGSLTGGYTYKGEKTRYNRYPVLLDGRLAPVRLARPPLPAAIKEVKDVTDGG
ncbi:hypothetical protein [Rhodopirellula sp. P2]|uniref:hypothetical protein n=1 Tax=Rhodopirellula sp. P2 TaxID=2127060 RepID=UPI002368BDB8|nr:hypothetical protein [Rhodopirellula sp. P2]WDQ15182.1 hypothetical protein PSR62_16220 [Rhodopirellula sp. P2]